METNLVSQGIIVSKYDSNIIVPISPITLFSGVFSPDPAVHHVVMGSCLRLLKSCDELHLHGDWKKSKGCMMEYDIAKELGIPTYIGNREVRLW